MTWRAATPADDDALVEQCLALYAEDPGPQPVGEAQVRRTLDVLRAAPARGRAVVLELAGRVEGYALLVPFWSNEAGGEICTIDELYVAPAFRSRGFGSALIEQLARDERDAVAVQLEVTNGNARALALYSRLGFRAGNRLLRRMR